VPPIMPEPMRAILLRAMCGDFPLDSRRVAAGAIMMPNAFRTLKTGSEIPGSHRRIDQKIQTILSD
jgi:hypothetical protein